LIFALHQSVGRGLLAADANCALASTKIAAGILLFAISLMLPPRKSVESLWVPTLLTIGAPTFAGRWLNFTALFGGAVGPAINGLTVQFGFDDGFLILACFTTLRALERFT
jgi:hypothetical protein